MKRMIASPTNTPPGFNYRKSYFLMNFECWLFLFSVVSHQCYGRPHFEPEARVGRKRLQDTESAFGSDNEGIESAHRQVPGKTHYERFSFRPMKFLEFQYQDVLEFLEAQERLTLNAKYRQYRPNLREYRGREREW